MRSSFLIGCILSVTTTGCNGPPVMIDVYEKPFVAIAIGDSRDRLIEMMGPPDSMNSLGIPLVQLEELSWRSPAHSRTYKVKIVNNRVAVKQVN